MRVKPALAPNEFLVRADFDDLALTHADDAGARASRRQPMGDYDDGSAAHDRAHVLLNDPLAVVIER